MNAIREYIYGLISIVLIGWLIFAWAVGYTYFSGQSVIIDNPTDKEISVKINDEEYKVEPKWRIIAKVGYRESKVYLNNEEKGTFKKEYKFEPLKWMGDYTKIFKKDILNPTNSIYFISYEIYGGSSTNGIKDKVTDKLLIPVEWNYDLDQDFPDVITTKSRITKSITKSKIFRKDDYIKTYDVDTKELEKYLEEEFYNKK